MTDRDHLPPTIRLACELYDVHGSWEKVAMSLKADGREFNQGTLVIAKMYLADEDRQAEGERKRKSSWLKRVMALAAEGLAWGGGSFLVGRVAPYWDFDGVLAQLIFVLGLIAYRAGEASGWKSGFTHRLWDKF